MVSFLSVPWQVDGCNRCQSLFLLITTLLVILVLILLVKQQDRLTHHKVLKVLLY